MRARNALLMMASFLASRLLGLVREQVIAARLGTSPDYDAYIAAFRIPDFLYLVIMGGALGSALIPVIAEHRSRDDTRAAQELANTVLTASLMAMLAAAAAAALLAEPLLSHLVVPGLAPAQQRLAVQLTRILLASPILLGTSGVVMAYLNAHHKFLGPALAPIAYNLSIIVSALVFVPSMGVVGLAVGVGLGSVLNLGVQVPDLARLGYHFTPSLHVGRADFRRVAALLVPRMFGQAAYQANFIVTTAIASTLASGSISALNYAYLLMMLPHGIFAMSVAVSSFPTMADQVARGYKFEMQQTLVTSLSTVIFLAIPSALGLSMLGFPLVRLLFEMGAFGASSTEMVGQALTFFAFGVIPYGAVEILTRAFYAFGDTRRPVAASSITVAINLLLGTMLSRRMGHSGLALALVVATAVEAILMAAMLRRYLGWSWLWPTLRQAYRALAACGPMAILLALAITLGGDLVGGRRDLEGILGLSSVLVGGAAVYVAAAVALKSDPALQFVRMPLAFMRNPSRSSGRLEDRP